MRMCILKKRSTLVHQVFCGHGSRFFGDIYDTKLVRSRHTGCCTLVPLETYYGTDFTCHHSTCVGYNNRGHRIRYYTNVRDDPLLKKLFHQRVMVDTVVGKLLNSGRPIYPFPLPITINTDSFEYSPTPYGHHNKIYVEHTAQHTTHSIIVIYMTQNW